MDFLEYLFERDATTSDLAKVEENLKEDLKDYSNTRSDTSAFILKKEITNLKIENGKLKLIVAAIVKNSFEKGIFTQEEIQALCKDIDAEDGKVDGQYNKEVLATDRQEQLKRGEINIDFSGNVRERKSQSSE